MKWIGLKVICFYGAFLELILTEDEYRDVVNKLNQGEKNLSGIIHDKAPMGAGNAWWFRSDMLIAFHTFNVADILKARSQQMQQQGLQLPWNPASGR